MMLIMGGHPRKTIRVDSNGHIEAKRQRNAKIIVVDPTLHAGRRPSGSVFLQFAPAPPLLSGRIQSAMAR